MADIEKIKKLREKTGISVMECKKAIEKADGDLDKAEKFLRKAKDDLQLKRKGEVQERELLLAISMQTKR